MQKEGIWILMLNICQGTKRFKRDLPQLIVLLPGIAAGKVDEWVVQILADGMPCRRENCPVLWRSGPGDSWFSFLPDT